MVSPKAGMVFEASWEVCNKVGGIYTVVSSKANQMITRYGKENYVLIGPHFPKKSWGVFEDKLPPEHLQKIFDDLRKEGIICTYGTWLVKGNPDAILIDFSGFAKDTDAIKKALWDWFQIDSLGTQYFDFDEPIIWSFAVGKLIERIHQSDPSKQMVAHLHEWLCGAALLYLKRNAPKVGTIFTTHATILGRALSSGGVDLYGSLKSIDPENEARRMGQGLWAKFQVERACARNASVFTTVSEITGIEAEYLLGRKPDVLLLNGLDMDKFPTFEEASLRHRHFKSKIKEFCLSYFFPYTPFDLDDTLFYFLAGRYEFRDKGVDVFIKSLAIVNDRLVKAKSNRTVVAFIFIPGNVRSTKHEVLENRSLFEDLRDSVTENIETIQTRMLYGLIQNKDLGCSFLFEEESMEEIHRRALRIRKKGSPPISTHDLFDEDQDTIVKALREVGLDNRAENRVKVVFYPIYLSGADNLLNTTYYESMHGCHLGVFPSLYEPWGYTPLEASALGVPSITTDLAGFGRYVQKQGLQKDIPGIYVLRRFNVPDSDVIGSMADMMHQFAIMSKQDRVQDKIEARKIAETADWKFFADYYIEAHNLAVAKR